jgi:murein DD-endopeptidase MepM/ murein hydrolase activator NlpD
MQKLRLCGNARENARVQRRSVGTVLGMASAAVLLTGWIAAPDRQASVDTRPPAALETAAVAPAISPRVIPEPGPEPVEPGPTRSLRVVEGSLGHGHSLSGALTSRGVAPALVHIIARELSSKFDFRYSKPGDHFRLVQQEDGSIVEFRYSPNELVSHYLTREGDGYETRTWEAEQVRQTARIAGVVNSSLYDAVTQLGEHPQLAGDFAEIFAWDVDFTHSVRRGDEFSILYERLYRLLPDGREIYEGPGRILAAHYDGGDVEHTAVYFEPEEGRGGYYRPDGTSVQRQFLRAPLSFRRVSSGYTLSRLHPILKVRRPHQGIDYAAPTGTPVWAVASGKVVFRGRQGGFGNMVRVRHPNGYVSYYGHLSRFAKGLAVGDTVSQKQVVGYVGSTGLSTGPHLDFRMKKNGRYVNPSRISSPAGPPIPTEVQESFHLSAQSLLAQLDPQPIVVTNEAL